jgi:RNA polymerase sigma factor (sigma-70 family)
MKQSPVKIDPLLEPLLSESSEERAEQLIMGLITVQLEPVIKGVIRYKLHLSSFQATQQAEADDLCQEVILQLLGQLRQFRAQSATHPITDVRGMAAVITHRTCARWMRRQFPERHALKNRLNYLLTRQRGLALWPDSEGKMVAGFAAWQGKKEAPGARIGDLSEVSGLARHIQGLRGGKQQELAAILAGIFNHLGGPIEFDKLVTALAALLGISERPVESPAEDEDAVAIMPTAEPDPAWRVEKRIFLQRLWKELQLLPLNQRAALLLNLKESGGGGCITLFPVTGIANLRQLADTLEISAERFARLWNELPLEDSRIADLLNLTRQQVINARKSGRERLARRLKGFF